MPLKRMCQHRGCSEVIADGRYCERHQADARQYDQYRETAAQRGYGSQWRKAREGYLRKHPLCVHCRERGILKEATVVDHIIPHKGDKELFWERDNWQPLCETCHNVKTATEDGGFGRTVTQSLR
ncbi:HNH endonuclease [Paenibacillus campi]|uniref:HNH endonuclease n=1 Tax=Paenibacillus campi TaxID=3106031 RepID=UPI002AFE7093|nr:HNH endonuclease [Paenibacillus sp. SGZ-1014]